MPTGSFAAGLLLLLFAAPPLPEVPAEDLDEDDEGSDDAEEETDEGFDPFMDLLDAHHVRYIVGGGDRGIYLEADRPWLCLWDDAGEVTCYAWPRDLPRVVWLYVSSAKGSQLHLGTATSEWVFQARRGPGALDLVSVSVRCRASSKDMPYTMPPSRRPKAAKACAAPKRGTQLLPDADPVPWAIVRAFVELQHETKLVDLAITSVEHAGTSLVSLRHRSDEDEEMLSWSCHRPPDTPRICTSTDLGEYSAIHPEKTLPEGWLLHTNSGIHRFAEARLLWVGVKDDTFATFGLLVGAVDGYGEDCSAFVPRTEGYCVLATGNWTPFKVSFPLCVRILPTLRWSAVHIRMQDRWIGERRLKAPRKPEEADEDDDMDEEGLPWPPALGTYRLGPEGWHRAPCR
jgi:hypothetical protein